ncbi:LPS assembly protein LptD [Candidatus Pelagibacter sp.]|uniref:LPS assembly protein LptD n=1 Tax=Candidatus Pelagibacter sp. TaxID=2024849 RepID=UPI003F84AA51
MKNKLIKFFLYIFLSLTINIHSSSDELINLNITEIEITDNGNILKGYNGGEAITDDGISILAENFEYNKILTHLIATKNVIYNDNIKEIVINADKISYIKKKEEIEGVGKVVIKDQKRNLNIFADKIFYFKKQNQIIAKGNVKIIDLKKNLTISADEVDYFKKEEKIIANGNVKFDDPLKEIIIKTNTITYFKKLEKIYSEGKTEAKISSKYVFKSSNITFNKKNMEFFSSNKTEIRDDNNSLYNLNSFHYEIQKEFLKGTQVSIVQNMDKIPSERNNYFFENGFFDLKNKIYKTGATKISLNKNMFDRSENDPRVYGVSSEHKNGITTVKKAVFTSCKKNDTCPPWSIESSLIKHDKKKKKIIYDNSILKFYNLPVFYFPKFFHPDPTVNRQSGFLMPKISSSNVLGSSISTPYFHVISENKDFTFNPVLYSKKFQLFQNEYRQENKRSSLILDFGYVNDFKSSSTKKKKDSNHLFAKFKKNLNLENFNVSDFNFFLERVNKDTYIKIFSDNFIESKIRPINYDMLKSGFDLLLENDDFLLTGGAEINEDLTKIKSDRYQYVFPYYKFTQNPIYSNYGSLNFSSSGSNVLDQTNNLKSRIINDVSFKLNDKIFEGIGIKNNINLYLKNLNSIGKNVQDYKSSPQFEVQSLIELNSELPLLRSNIEKDQTLIPRISLRLNPSDMKNHKEDKRKINTDNIFNINRLGIDDSLESGNSLTFGINYRSENREDNNKYLDFKLASVLRDDIEERIPTQTTLNKKNSNIFGSVDFNLSENINLDYQFATDNKIENFTYNSVGLNFSLNNFVTEFNFIKEDFELGNTNIFENITSFNFDEKNSLSFKTRRNRELNLTEYYNLVYEYKNDCLTAGIQFNKTFYEDSDLKPSENLIFKISFYPITSIEQKIE